MSCGDVVFFFFNDTATTEIYTLSLHDALPISSATPPMERHARKASHGKMAGHTGKGPKLSGSTANQLNQEELARLQAGNFSNPSAPPPPGPGMMPPPSGPRTSGSSGAGPR